MTGDGAVTVTTAGTRVSLSATSIRAAVVFVQAKAANTKAIFVGGSTIAAGRGVLVEAYGSITFPPIGDRLAYDLSEIYVDATVNGEGATFTWSDRG